MKLKSFGCSFIFGTDLADDGRLGPVATPSLLTFPALIAQDKGMEYSCRARPGAGNFEILCRLLDEIATGEPALYMINWTWIDRFSYIDEERSMGCYPFNPQGWHSIMPVDDDEIARLYYRALHTQLKDKLLTLTCVKSAIDDLLTTGNQFIMTWTDALMWETQWHCPPAVRWMQDRVKSYHSAFQGSSFIDWSQQQGFEISATMHPLEQAHQAAAKLVLENWDSYIRC